MKPGMALIRHYLQFRDFRAEEYAYLFERAATIKKRFKNYEKYTPLVDRTLAMIFEKASTRTRVSFEAGMYQMGGSVVNLTATDSQLGRAEPVEDTARVISRMVDIVMIRTFEQTKLEAFAAHSRVPVINGLTNEYHPCQILADVFTCIEQRGSMEGKIVAWVGDGNNMATTWLQAADILGFTLHVSTPNGYEIDPMTVGLRRDDCLKVFKHPLDACRNADVVTTDVWTSMGYEAENAERKVAFADWCVDAEMMAAARPDALFMHCLPAHRGEEVEAEVIDGPQSVVWDEAENRMHVQKALMEYLLRSARRSGQGAGAARSRRLLDDRRLRLRRPAGRDHRHADAGHRHAEPHRRRRRHAVDRPLHQRRDRRREVEQAGDAGRLAAAQQQVEDGVGADRRRHDVIEQGRGDLPVPVDREAFERRAQRQQDERRDREVDADRGPQVDRGAELALVERAAVTAASAQATASRLGRAIAAPSTRWPTTSATPPRPTATPSICSADSRSCSQRDMISAVSIGCSARISAVTPAERPQRCA